MKPAIVSKMPPQNLRAFALQGQPDGNVGFVVEIGHDDFAAGVSPSDRQRLANGQADEAHERGGVHAKRNFVGMPRVHQQGDAGAGL